MINQEGRIMLSGLESQGSLPLSLNGEEGAQQLPFPLLDLPPPAYEAIFRQTLCEDRRSFFLALASKKAEKVRSAAWAQLKDDLRAIISNPDACLVYYAVFDEHLPSMEIFQQSDVAIGGEYKKITRVCTKWNALPKDVQSLGGNIDSAQMLSNVESFIFALKTISSYAFICKAEKLGQHVPSSFPSWISLYVKGLDAFTFIVEKSYDLPV